MYFVCFAIMLRCAGCGEPGRVLTTVGQA